MLTNICKLILVLQMWYDVMLLHILWRANHAIVVMLVRGCSYHDNMDHKQINCSNELTDFRQTPYHLYCNGISVS